MYAWLWRQLPGPLPLRLACALVLLTVVIVVLFTRVFPWLSNVLPITGITVG